MPNVEGVLFSTGNCGLKKKEKDLAIIQLDNSSKTTAVFTTSKTIAEPVKWSKKNINNKIKAIVVNSGNANALTGKKGLDSIKNYTKLIANKINKTNATMFKSMPNISAFFGSTRLPATGLSLVLCMILSISRSRK